MMQEAASTLARLRRYVELESPTGDVARATRLAGVLASDLETAGVSVERVEAPGYGLHLYGRLEGTAPREAPLVLLGHMDTVHPAGTLADQPFTEDDGRAAGPGTFDMKAGLAVIVDALTDLRARDGRPRRPLRILISCDEEVGSPTSRGWIESSARGAAACLVLEPSLPGGLAKTARKGVALYRLTALGRAAHAGIDPGRGVNAIVELAGHVPGLLALAEPDLGTTLNLGVIRGGTASNVVPARAELEIDVRFATAAEGARVDTALRALRAGLPGARLQLEGGINRPPLERSDAGARLFDHVRRGAADVGFDLQEGATGGGSDGNFVAALGVPTVDGLGPQGDGAHTPDEHVLIDDLPRRVALLSRLLETL